MNDILGVISAGGASSRFGSPKALAEVGGARVVDRVAAAVRSALGHDDIVAIVNDAAVAAAIALPHRPDQLRDVGAVAGVHAALAWSLERGCRGVLLVACDMPLVDAGLLRHIASLSAGADIVIPESTGRRGVEPLCAYYATSCLPALERAVAAGDRRMIGFHDDVSRVVRVPIHVVEEFGDPGRIFLNLNSPADVHTAEQWLGGNGAAG